MPCATLNVASSRSPAAASASVTVPSGAISVTGVFWLVETDPDTCGDHRRIIDRRDVDRRGRKVAALRPVIHHPADAAAGIGAEARRVVAARGERDRFQRRLILRNRRRPAQRQHPAPLVAAGNAVLIGEVENIPGQQAARDTHRRRGQRRAISITDRQRRINRRRNRLQLGIANRIAGIADHRRLIDRCNSDRGRGLAAVDQYAPSLTTAEAAAGVGAEVGRVLAARGVLNPIKQRLVLRKRRRVPVNYRTPVA